MEKTENTAPPEQGAVLPEELITQSQSAPANFSEENDNQQLFMWASPVSSEKHAFSSPQVMYKRSGSNHDQGSPDRKQFARDMFVHTGLFDQDINRLLEEAGQGVEQSPGEVGPQNESMLSEDEEALQEQLARQLPSEHSGLVGGEEGSYIDNQSMEQGHFSVGELSLSADSYILEDSANQSRLSTSATMDQSIRSAIASLHNGRPSDASEIEESPSQRQHPNNEENDDELHFEQEKPVSHIPSPQHQNAGNMNDSFSSEVTEPELQVQQEPPIALLMYSQPKVWTDDSGEPTKLEEDEEGEQEEMDSDEEENGPETGNTLTESHPSNAGLWMQEDMLQTIVPFRKTQSNPSKEKQNPDTSTHVETAENIANVSSASRSSVQSTGSTASTSHGKTSIQRSSSAQSIGSSRNQSKSELKDVSNSSISSDRSAKITPSKIPLTVRSTQNIKSSSSQQTSTGSLKNTSSESLTSHQSKPSSTAQLKDRRVTQQHSAKDTTKVKSTSSQSIKKAVSKTEKLPHMKSDSSLTGGNLQHKKSEPSHDLSHRSISSISSVDSRFDVVDSSRPITQHQNHLQKERERDISPSDKLAVASSQSDQLSPQEAMLQELHQSRIALQHQGQRQKASLTNLQSHEISGLKSQTVPQSVQAYLFSDTQQGQMPKLSQSIGLQSQQIQQNPLQNQGASGHSFNMQQLKSVHQQAQSKPVTQTLDELLSDVGTDVFSMEQVRGHLHTMLKQTTHTIPEKSYDAGQMSSLVLNDDQDNDSFMSNSTFPTAASKSLADLTAQMESIGGYGVASIPPASTIPSHNVPRGDSTLIMENQLIRESLEKEMFRRKHCEKQIHLLQSKSLEIQQQLAVAVNTDRKKDNMIEQLDKALAKVVEGWRKRESEKVDIIHRLQTENTQFVQRCDAQQELLHKFEAETAVVVDQLTAAQQSVEQSQRERDHKVAIAERQKFELLESLEETQDKLQSKSIEMERYLHKAETLGEQLCDTRATLEAEREAWEDKEREFLQKIDEITNNHMRVIEQGKLKSDQQTELLGETHDLLTAAQSEVHQLRMKLDSAIREKESLHVQLGILESKMENSLRKQEADLRSEAEREVSEKLSEAHRRQRCAEEEINARHRQQITDLSQRHSAELKDLTRQHQDALRRKDEAVTEKALEFEDRLDEGRTEIDTLKTYVNNLESQRMEVTARLQARMQAHFNEALGILMNGDAANNADLTASVKKQLDGMYSMGTESTLTEHHVDKSVNQKSIDDKHTEQSNSVRQSQDGIPTTTTAGVFSAVQPDFSSPPEPITSRDSRYHANDTSIQPQLAARQESVTASRLEERHPSRFHTEVQPESNVDPNTNLPFQLYTLPGYQGNQGNQIGHHGNQRSHGQPQQEYHETQDNRVSNSFNVGNHGNQNQHQPQHHPVQSNIQQQQQRTQQHHLQQHYQQQQQQLQTSHSVALATTQMKQTEPSQMVNPGDELESRRLAQTSRPLVTRLEPSFLQTLASEADRQGGYHGSQNSSMMSEYEGLVPLPPDTSMSTIHDGEVPHHNITALSSGPLMDTTRFSEAFHQSVAANKQQHNETDYSVMSERFKQHDDRQQELQKYIKMLLNRTPPQAGSGGGNPEEGTPASQDVSLLTPTKGQPSPVQFRGQGHPPGVAFSKVTVASSSLLRPDLQGNHDMANQGNEEEQHVGGLSLGQAGEISRLLGIYRSRASVDPQTTDDESGHYFQSGASNRSQSGQTQGQSGQSGSEAQTTQKVIKVPTGVTEPAPKSSPTRSKPGAKGPTKMFGARQTGPGPAAGKPGPKTTGAPSDKKDGKKGVTKVWK